MKLTPDDQAWCPAERPEYLCLLRRDQKPPVEEDEFLLLQLNLLNRLLKESSEEEKGAANRRLEHDLPAEAKVFLPSDLLMNPQTPHYLLFNPQVEGSPAHRWQAGFLDLRNPPLMPQQEALALAKDLCLNGFINRLLECKASLKGRGH